MKTFLKALLLIPLALLALGFALANRGPLTLSLDPFAGGGVPAFAFTVPVFVTLFVAVLTGVFLGGFGAWLGQARHRRAARTRRREAAELRAANERLRAEALRPAPPPPATSQILAPSGLALPAPR